MLNVNSQSESIMLLSTIKIIFFRIIISRCRRNWLAQRAMHHFYFWSDKCLSELQNTSCFYSMYFMFCWRITH